MTYEEKVRWLRRYQESLRREQELAEEVERLQSEATRITPAGVDAAGNDLLPYYSTGSAGGAWALTDGYLRSQEGIQYMGTSIRRTTLYQPQLCRLDRDALLSGNLSLTEIRSDF